MKINEKILKNIMNNIVLGQCDLAENTYVQVAQYVKGEISLNDFNAQTRKDLSELFEANIQKPYSFDTGEFLPNIFVDLE